MATIGGPNSAFEKDLAARLKKLEESIEKYNIKITKILTEAIESPQLGTNYWKSISKSIETEYKQLYSLLSEWSKVEIPKAYRRSLQELMSKLNSTRDIAKRASKNFTEMSSSSKSSQITSFLYQDANASLLTALTTGKQNIDRLLRQTRQTIVSEALIDESIAKAIKEGNLSKSWYLGVKDPVLVKAMKANAEFINDRYYVQAGKRRYTVEYYAQMVARVKFHEAQAYSAIETAKNYNTDLVQVSNHNTKTEQCMLYENKIYSIGGLDKRFPLLQAVPPYHTNCLHLLSVVFIEGMEVQDTVEQWSKFSKGETNVPPAPSNFVPVTEREAV